MYHGRHGLSGIIKKQACSSWEQCATANSCSHRWSQHLKTLFASNHAVTVLLQGSKVMLHPRDAQDPDVANDIMLLPDTETLADRPKPCLAEVASLPRDWTRLFDGQLLCIGAQLQHCLRRLDGQGHMSHVQSLQTYVLCRLRLCHATQCAAA